MLKKNTKVLDKKAVSVNMVPKPSHNYIKLTTNRQSNLTQSFLTSSWMKSYN